MPLRRITTVAVVVGVLAVAAAVGFVREFSGDFHWHVVLGNELLDHGRLYTHDYHSYTARGAPMFNTSWLADVALALLYRIGGYAGAYGLRALALMVLCACVMREAARRGVSPAVAGLLALFLLAHGTFRFYLRPETFAFALLGGLLLALGAHQRTRDARYLAAVAVLMVAWANVHGSVGIGVMIVGAYAAQWLFEELHREREERDRRVIITACALPVVGFALACANPHGIWLPLAFMRVQPTHTATVLEYLPITLANMPVMLKLALLVVGATTAVALLTGRRTSPWHLIALLVLVYFAHRYRRFAMYGLVVACPLVATNLAVVCEALGQGARGRRWRRLGSGLAVVAAAWFLFVLVFDRRLPGEIGTGLDPQARVFPDRACRFLTAQGRPGPVFNSYDLGNYLMFCLGPDYPLAIDQRAQSLYSEEFYRRYRAAAGSQQSFRAFMDEYPATWAVVDRDPFAVLLSHDRERWVLVYFDDRAQVFANRADARAAGFIAVHGFRLLGPERLGAVTELPAAALPEARTELERQVATCAECVRTDQMRAALAIAASDDEAFAVAIDRLLSQGETTEVAFLSARHALAHGDFDTAAVMFARFRALGGDALTPILFTARAYAKRGDFERASAVLDQAADLPGAGPVIDRARARIEAERQRGP